MTDWMRRFVVIDLETTGLSSTHDRITEIGIAIFENGRFTKVADYFVNPEGRVITDKITEITGIRVEDVMDAPPFWAVWNDIAPLLYDAVPIGWNAPFDRSFLFAAIARSWPRRAFSTLPWCLQPEVRWVDAQLLARDFFRDELGAGRGYKLEKVAEHVGMHFPEKHRADVDAHVTGGLLLHMVNQSMRTPGSALAWDWASMVERQQRAGYRYAAQQWFWNKKNPKAPEQAYLPKGQVVQVYECDVCHRMQPGLFLDKGAGPGWTKPDYWIYYGGPSEQDRVACSDACATVAAWHSLQA